MAKQIFSVIVNTGDLKNGNKGFIKYREVYYIQRLKNYLNTNYPQWIFATVYDKATREKLEVIKP